MKDLEAYFSSTLLPLSPRLFRTTVLDFLPSKLEPLGFSPDGQLRVASQFATTIFYFILNLYHFLVDFFLLINLVDNGDNYFLIQPPPKTL